MSVLNPAPTMADLQAATKLKIQERVQSMYNMIKASFGEVFNLCWANPDGLSAQQVFDSFGADAASLFQIASAIQTALNTVEAESLPQVPPNKFTINQDGTVTVSVPIPVGP